MADDWNCSELQHIVIGAHLNRIKTGSYVDWNGAMRRLPDRWVCDECYDHMFIERDRIRVLPNRTPLVYENECW